uniref:Uncharacterized protein n=1 Tax=Arundo donax TaxID=35708 RepID=A0A0A9B4J3_ARUDO
MVLTMASMLQRMERVRGLE